MPRSFGQGQSEVAVTLFVSARFVSGQPRRCHQRAGAGIEGHPALFERLGDLLAELDPELVEGVDPEQDGIGESAVFVESDQRAKAGWGQRVDKDGGRGAVAGIGPRPVLRRAPRHQCRALREAVHQEDAVVRGIEAVARHDAGDEINRQLDGPLMQQLEHRVLRVGPHPAPGDRRRRHGERLARQIDPLAVRLHFELLEVEGQQPQPLVIGKAGAGLEAQHRGIIMVGKGRAQAQVGRAIGLGKMAVHRRRAIEHFGKSVPTERQRDGKADAAPQRIAPADAFGERQHAGLVHPPFDRLFGRSGQRRHPAEGVGHPIVAQPVERGERIGHGLGGGKGLGGDRDQRGRRVAGREGRLERAAIDVRDDMDRTEGAVAGQRVDRHCRPQRRTADADVDEVLDRAQSAAVDRTALGRFAREAQIMARVAHPNLIGIADIDAEGRFLQADFGDLSIVSIYLPSGSSGEHRQAAKFYFMEQFFPVLKNLMASGQEIILCGDWNIAHQEIDLKNWRSNQKNSGFLPEERAWLSEVLDDIGFVDVFRRLNNEPDQYTWWSNRGQAWAKNVGWRIDYQIATPTIAQRARRTAIFKDERFSDHAPLIIDYDYDL